MIYMENSHVRNIFRSVPDDVVRNFIRLPRVYPATTTTKATTVTDATAVKIFQQRINNEFWKKFTHDIKRKVTNLAIQWRRVGLKINCQDVDRKNVVICSTYWNQDFTLQALWDKKNSRILPDKPVDTYQALHCRGRYIPTMHNIRARTILIHYRSMLLF